MTSITATVSVATNSMTVSGTKTLGTDADIVFTAVPSDGSASFVLGTLPAAPDGAYSSTMAAPAGSYTVNVATSQGLSSSTTSPATVAPSMLLGVGNNTLDMPANVVVTATPTAGGSPITVSSLSNVPPGPFAISAPAPAGDYSVVTVASVNLSASTSVSADVPSADFTATISLSGASYVFDMATGKDQGDYTDPVTAWNPTSRFTTGCIAVTNPGLPGMTVRFMSNKSGPAYDSVSFEYGDCFTTKAPTNLGAYTATIVKAGVTLYTANVPQHFWHSAWRWQSAPRPVTVTVAQLVAAKLLPAFDPTLAAAAKPNGVFSYTPMTLAGLTPYMPQTGERNDIGLITGWQAEWVCRNDAAALATFMAQAEAIRTFPIGYIDETTGAPVNTLDPKYAKASTYTPNAGSAPLIPVLNDFLGTGHLVPDPAHEPEASFLPFLLTGDPWFLLNMQLQATFNILELPYASRYGDGGGVRAFAWSMRTAGRLATVCPATVPSWLLPQSNFEQQLANYLAWMDKSIAMAAPAPEALFRAVNQTALSALGAGRIVGAILFDFWQSDFITATLCDLMRMGQSSVVPRLQWSIQSVISRTNGTSGWPRAVPSLYNVYIVSTQAPTVPTTWAELFENNVLTQPAQMVFDKSDPTGNAKMSLPSGGAMTYISYARGVLALAAKCGDPVTEAAVAASFTWLDAEIRALAANNPVDFKWAIA